PLAARHRVRRQSAPIPGRRSVHPPVVRGADDRWPGRGDRTAVVWTTPCVVRTNSARAADTPADSDFCRWPAELWREPERAETMIVEEACIFPMSFAQQRLWF